MFAHEFFQLTPVEQNLYSAYANQQDPRTGPPLLSPLQWRSAVSYQTPSPTIPHNLQPNQAALNGRTLFPAGSPTYVNVSPATVPPTVQNSVPPLQHDAKPAARDLTPAPAPTPTAVLGTLQAPIQVPAQAAVKPSAAKAKHTQGKRKGSTNNKKNKKNDEIPPRLVKFMRTYAFDLVPALFIPRKHVKNLKKSELPKWMYHLKNMTEVYNSLKPEPKRNVVKAVKQLLKKLEITNDPSRQSLKELTDFLSSEVIGPRRGPPENQYFTIFHFLLKADVFSEYTDVSKKPIRLILNDSDFLFVTERLRNKSRLNYDKFMNVIRDTEPKINTYWTEQYYQVDFEEVLADDNDEDESEEQDESDGY